MKKKFLAGLLSVLMSVTMYSPVRAEEPSEPDGSDPEITEIQETEISSSDEETFAETAETEVLSATDENEEQSVTEAAEPAEEDVTTDEPAETPEITDEPAVVEEPAEETDDPGVIVEENSDDSAADDEMTDEESAADDEETLEEESEEITLITPDPVTYNGVTVSVSYYSDVFDRDVTLVAGEAGEAETAALTALGKDYKAIDISFVDEDGNPVQPAEGKTVSVSLQAAGMETADYYEAVHVDADGKVEYLAAETTAFNPVTEQIKTGETSRTVYVPAETETVTVEDYREETYTDYETRETVVEVPAEISYRNVLKSRVVEKPVVFRSLLKGFLFGSANGNNTYIVKNIEYYYENEPYVTREAYTKTVTETVPVEKTRTVLAGTHEETRVVREAYSYEETDDVFETVTTKDVETVFDAAHFSVYAVIAGSTAPEARGRVEFYGIDTSAPLVTYYVKNSDELAPADEADKVPNKQYIDDIVTDPGIGGQLPGNQVFLGWYIGDTDDYTVDTAPKTIGDIRQYLSEQTYTEGETVIKVYAMIFRIFTVTYLDEQNVSLGSDEVKVRTTTQSSAYTVSKTYTPVDPTKNFDGWMTENDSSISDAVFEGEAAEEPYKMGTTMTISGDITFTVSAPRGRWLVFDENAKGATYNAPQFVKDGQVTKAPALAMTRLGYEFVGWYTERYADDETPDESKEFVFGEELTEPTTTIYAKWRPVATAHYTVIYWKQNVDGSAYDFDHSQTVTGTVGTAINVTSSNTTVRVTGADPYTVEKGFSFKEADEGKTVSAAGNTVVNVYIQRNQYTLTFRDYLYTATSSNNGTQYGLVDGTYVELSRHRWGNQYYWTYGDTFFDEGPVYTGTRYTRSQDMGTVKEITAYYEQNISGYFPIEGTNGRIYNRGERWKPGSNNLGWTEVMVFVDTMPNENVTFTLNEANRPLKTMNYYVEALDTDTNTITHNGKKYVLYNSISARYNGVTAEDFIDLDGYAKVEATAYVNGPALTPHTVYGLSGQYYIASTTEDQTIYFFYTRLKYAINFMDGAYFDGDGNPLSKDDYPSVGQWKAVNDVVYGSNLSSYNKGGTDYYEPVSPYPGFIFEGWYIDDRCTTPYTFTTMPKGGVTLFAKWRQVQYRVFMHPNAKLPDGTNDSSLDWGSSAQGLSFRVPYMGQVSMPVGLRDEYEFIGWFLDEEAMTRPFNEDTKLTEDIVTADYDKTDPANYTDPMNKFGEIEGQGSNSDLTGNNGGERFWITKKLDLYGKWSALLTGAQGIGVMYDANGGSNAPSDTRKYKDNVQAVAQAASTPPAKHRFLYWVVQKWDGTAYIDVIDSTGSPLVVYPGDGFTVLKDYAKVTDLTPGDEGYEEGEVYKAYTMQLRAEYGPEEANKDTYMNWYKNDEDPSDLLHKDKDLLINQAVDIYTLSAGIPERTGYKFLGWGREQEYELSEDLKPVGDAITYYDLSEDDLYLKWIEEAEGQPAHYEAKNAAGEWVTVTQVAADEKMPYQAWYAIWAPDYFYIFHSATGDLEAIQYIENIDLTEKITEGYLYGGYYSAYSAYTVTDADKTAAQKSADLKKHVTDSVYNPAAQADHIGRWNSENAYTQAGDALTPDAKTVYYLKEVPVSYLRNYYQITYVKSTGALTGLYLLSAVDDMNYDSAGFVLKATDSKDATIVQSLAITNSGTGKTVTLKANTAFRSNGITADGGGYLGYWDATGSEYYAQGEFTVLPYWITIDGVTVNGISTRTVKISSLTKAGISKTDN